MTTKADLNAEFVHLRQKQARTDSPPAPEAESGDTPPAPDNAPDWAELLGQHGLDIDDPAGLIKQLTKELDTLARDKPLLTASAAFGLGFVLGRMSK